MAGVNPKILSNSLSRARDLITDPNFNKLVERNARNNSSDFYGENYNSSELYNENYNIPLASKKNTPINISNMPQSNFTNSKLPKEILDELRNNPLEYQESQSSIIDNLIDPIAISNKPLRSNRQVNEISKPSSSGIDYTIIKAIIDESVRRNLDEYMQKTLNESKNDMKLLRLSKGNKIQVVDSKGNLYEGVLSLKKNLNNK